MITYETLKVYKDRCEAALGQVEDGLAEAREDIELLEKQQLVIAAQIETLDNLMDIKKSPPVVELPLVGPEDIEEMFDKRLETHDGSPDAETYRDRQDVYLKEAMETVETLDAANRVKSEED